MSKHVPVGKHSTALVDDDTYEWVSQWTWTYCDGYARSITTKTNRKSYAMHRLIMCPPDDMMVDHINHNRLDNRRCNLRIVTPSENSQNRLQQAQGRIIRLTWLEMPDIVAWLDTVAKTEGVSRADIVRRAIRQLIASEA